MAAEGGPQSTRLEMDFENNDFQKTTIQVNRCRLTAGPQHVVLRHIVEALCEFKSKSKQRVLLMQLIHCIYSSAATDANLSKEALEDILEQSRTNNAKVGITGMLLYEGGAFFQVLEGEEAIVESIYKKIEKDSRHERVTKIILEPIEERAFGEWSMGYPRVSKKDLSEIDGLNDFFSKGNSFIELEEGRAKLLLKAFHKGKWRV